MGNSGLEFFVAVGRQQQGPFAVDRLRAEGVTGQTLVWREGMPSWRPAGKVPELVHLFASPVGVVPPAGFGPPPSMPPSGMPLGYAAPGYLPPGSPIPSDVQSKKILAGIMAILFGTFGVHKFVLGQTSAGLIRLACTILGACILVGPAAMHIIGIIEGIIYLSKTDEEFYRVYMVEQKAWF